MQLLRGAVVGGTLLAGLASPPSGRAGTVDDGLYRLTDAIAQGKVSLDVRYRYERVDQDRPATITDAAHAHTVRTRLGWRTGLYDGFYAYGEVEDITALGSEDYNDAANGKTRFPVVADPDGTEVNQAHLAYLGLPKTTLRYGRQVFKFDNERWLGDVGWRQNQQSFDALFAENKSLPGTTLSYARVTNVNRVFGEDTPSDLFANTGDLDMRSHLVNAQWKPTPAHALTAYAYLLDFEERYDAESTRSLGLRAQGEFALGAAGGSLGGGPLPGTPGPALLYTAEYARQSDYADNPDDFGLDYTLAEGGVRAFGVNLKLGYEVLEGGGEFGGVSGMRALQTPLATLHAFNGWADQFLRTPAEGLEDRYVTLGGPVPGWGLDWLVRYDRYQSEQGGTDYGSEWGAMLAKTFAARYTLGIKYARYATDADAFVPGAAFTSDVSKLWLWAQFKL
jgi:hypothetical protein